MDCMNQDTIYVTGHRNPDSDSIVAAIAYAAFKQRKGEDAVACCLGEPNAETKYLLQRFGFEEPMLLEDARATLADIEMDAPITISPDTTIHEAMKKMNELRTKTFGVVNERQQFVGLVTKSLLSKVGMGDTAYTIDLLKETPLEHIVKTIDGKMVHYEDELHFNGKVSIIAMAQSGLANYDIKDRLVIIGNDEEAQKKVIEMGAGIVVLVWCDDVASSVIEVAKAHHCPIIISGHGSMNTSRYLYFSPPVSLLMKRNVIRFNSDEFAKDAGKKMMKSRYRSYPVIDHRNHVVGYVSRYHILNYKNKKMILVDHNEYAQSVKGIETAELLEVIDHHRVCDIFTSRPISFRNEIIGSTTSIVASIYMENQMDISKELAGLMLGAILSDTLKFRSPTTTAKDIGIAKTLADKAGLDIDIFAAEMFTVSSNISKKSVRELITQDIKSFEIDDNKLMIAQVIVSSVSEVRSIAQEVQKELDQFTKERDLDLCVVAFTSILQNGSIFYASGEKKDAIFEAFPNSDNETHSFHEDVLSRKNQIVPTLSKALIH